MNAQSTLTVTVAYRFAASAERVFDAFLDVEKARRFMFSTPDGEMVRAEIDARVGGKFNFTDRRDGEDAEHVGEYVEIDRPHRLVFTFSDNLVFTDTVVTIEVVATDRGCDLTLTHELNTEAVAYASETTAGWTEMLADLDRMLAS